MPYKVQKLIEDQRIITCGFFLPHAGMYWVLEMTFENHRQLTNIGQRIGYSVDFVEGPPGFYDAQGYELNQDTIRVDDRTGAFLGCDRVEKIVRGKPSQKKAAHEDKEREAVVAEAAAMGLKTKWQSTQALKQRISDARRAPQSSLTVQ